MWDKLGGPLINLRGSRGTLTMLEGNDSFTIAEVKLGQTLFFFFKVSLHPFAGIMRLCQRKRTEG